MRGTKLVKGYCNKTKQYFALEVKKFGTDWKVLNMTNLSDDEGKILTSEVKQSTFYTHENLLACSKCGNRKVGGCSCPPRRLQCRKGMKYNFQCIYCNEFVIDNSSVSASDVSGMVGKTIVLSQGQEVKIQPPGEEPLEKLVVGVGWDPTSSGPNMDVDSSVYVASSETRTRETVYFSHKEHTNGCIIHHGDNLTGAGSSQGDDENIDIFLKKVPQECDYLFFFINIYEAYARSQTLSSVKNMYIRLINPKNKRNLLTYQIASDTRNATALLLGVATKKSGEWHFKALGTPLRVGNIREVCEECEKLIKKQ